MAKTASMMLELGTAAPNFSLPDVVSGEIVTLESFTGKPALLVMFICQHCPFVKHIEEELARIGKDYAAKGLASVAISANSIETHPSDAPTELKAQADRLGFNFPYCFDASQTIAKAYSAACTPDFFLFAGDRQLVYRGQLDDSRPGNNKPVDGKDLRAAIDAVLAGKAPATTQVPSIGCNIKWAPGNEPSYFGASAV